MELTVLGTGTCTPNPSRSPACYHIAIGPTKIILDPGPGAVNRIAAAGLDPFDADAIFISHIHPDHCSDLVYYLFSYKNCLSAHNSHDIRIVAPEGFKKAFAGLMEVFGQWTLSDDYDIVIEEVRLTEWEEAGVRYSSMPMLHGANGVGYRFEKTGGSSLAYSGDTGYCSELVELAHGSDALLVECSFPDGHTAEGHMRPSEIAETGILSNTKRLVLTHFYPVVDVDQAVKTIQNTGYKGEVIASYDGMKLTI